MLYRAWLTIRNFLRRLSIRLWWSAWVSWRQIQKTRTYPKPPASELGDGRVDGGNADPTLSSHLQTEWLEQARSSSYYGSHEPIGTFRQLEPSSHDDDDSGSDIAIQVLPPEGMLWNTYIPPSNTLRDIFRQTISVEYKQTNGSMSIFISPTPDNDLVPTKNWFFGASSDPAKVAAHVYPLIPSRLHREGNTSISTREKPEGQLNVTNFSPGVLPDGWEQHIHPEGRPTFYNAEKRIITESWIFDDEIYESIMSSSVQFDDFARTMNFEFPLDCHLVLEVEEKMEGSDQYLCGYYFVSHSTHSICWLEKVDVSELFMRAERAVSEARVKIQMEYQYWFHWASFPDVNEVTLPILDVMANHVRDARTDLLTSPDHTPLPFSLEEVNNWGSSVLDAREQLIHGQEHPTGRFVGRFMSFLCKNRYHNFYGEHGAQPSGTQSVYGLPSRPRSYLSKISSPMLLSAPDTHLSVMNALWVDKSALESVLSRFFTTLVEEWKDHAVYASILLNANVAFLAIPSNDPGDDFQRLHRSPTQITSYLSTVNSSASMLLALLLVRQNKIGNVSTFLENSDHPTRGLEILAILYSLPYVLLVWGLVTFFAAFFIMCFQYSDPVTRFVVGPVCFLAAFSIVWCVWIGWEESQDCWRWPRLTWIQHQWRWKILGRKSNDDKAPEGSPTDRSNKQSDWIRLRQLWWKATTSPPDAESLPVH